MRQTLQTILLTLLLVVGATFTVNAQAGFDTCVHETFDPNVHSGYWVGTPSVFGNRQTATCGAGPNSGYWYFISSTAGPNFMRQIEAQGIDMIFGGGISFDLIMGMNLGSPCEEPDSGYDVVLEVFAGFGTWHELMRFEAQDPAFQTWDNYYMQIPNNYLSPNVRLRLRQLWHAGIGNDHWAIDNVVIYCKNLDSPPIVSFNALSSFSCYNDVTFKNTTLGRVDTFVYDWGDGNIDTILTGDTTAHSTSFHTHSYASSGFYTVTCTGLNPFGSHDSTMVNVVQVNLTAAPAPTLCVPAVLGSCCAYGIDRFTFADIDTLTPDAAAGGWEDFGCDSKTAIKAGTRERLYIKTGGTGTNLVKAWIDYDNNRVFDASEEVFSNIGAVNHDYKILIQASSLYDTLVRMRIGNIQYTGSETLSPCDSITNGQYEDHTVWVTENTDAPVVEFNATTTTSICVGESVSFTDSSLNLPTAWAWDFGDGGTSFGKFPVHVFNTPGVFDITLISTNAYGSDTLVQPGLITVIAGPQATACQPVGGATTNYGTNDVEFGSIDNSSSTADVIGYEDYSCDIYTTVMAGTRERFYAYTPNWVDHNVTAWLDINNDNIFTSDERVFNNIHRNTHAWDILVPSYGVYDTLIRLRVGSQRFVADSEVPVCDTLTEGQYEDYSVMITANPNPPDPLPHVNDTGVCINHNVYFTDSSLNSPSSWFWEFGDGGNSTAQHPVHVYTTPGTYTVKLTATNANGSVVETMTDWIQVIDGPLPTPCTPWTTSSCCSRGINNVTFAGQFTNTTPDAWAGRYEDYACKIQATITAGTRVPIYVRTGGGVNETVQAWIDYNNDLTFTADEQIFYSISTLDHAWTPLIQSYGVYDTTLRMRVGSIISSQSTNMLGCDTITNGQYEDYSVVITANPDAPLPIFYADNQSGCAGTTVNFFDSTENSPVTWYWEFGDGDTSTLQNPSHTYTATGLYNVTLTCTNANGTGSTTENAFISILLPPPPTTCTPVVDVTNTCCGSGIYRVRMYQIDQTSSDATNGYEQFLCEGTVLTAGTQETILVRTDSIAKNMVKVWIDYNNDNAFDPVDELVFESYGQRMIHLGTINVATSPTFNTELRMRVANQPWPFKLDVNPCEPFPGLTYGQYEDYTIYIIPNPDAPIVEFEAVPATITCTGDMEFRDLTDNGPTSWLWDFGDGSTSTDQHPTHTYLANGYYDVVLTATNAVGSNTLTKLVYAEVAKGSQPVKAVCEPATIFANCLQFGIYNVTYGDINWDSECGDESYQDFTCGGRTSIIEAKDYTFSIIGSPDNAQDVKVWIDANRNGIFEESELVLEVYSQVHPSGIIYLEGKEYEYDVPLRMRVSSDYAGGFLGPCFGPARGQVEDYTIFVEPNPDPPVAEFGSNIQTTCLQRGIQFADSSENVVRDWYWDFGDGKTSTLEQPYHFYTATGVYDVSLKVCGLGGCDSITKTAYITIDDEICTSAVGWDPSVVSYCEGILYDGGGPVIPDSPYSNNSFANFTIAPTGASSVTLTMTSFEYYAGDTLFFYDGPSHNDPLIGMYSGITLPPPITATSGVMHIIEKTNQAGRGEGFEASWACNDPGIYAGFKLNPSTSDSCGSRIGLINTSRNATTYHWLFGDGDTSTSKNPEKTFPATYSPPEYEVTLTASNATQSDTLTRYFTNYTLDAGFFTDQDTVYLVSPYLGIVQFFDTSEYFVTSWLWDFGDGDFEDHNLAPVHIYDSLGVYTVTLRVKNKFCTQYVSKDIHVLTAPSISGIWESGLDQSLEIFPNPSLGEFTVAILANRGAELKLSVLNLLGKEVYAEDLGYVKQLKHNMNLEHLKKGIYFVKITGLPEEKIRKIIIQ